MSSAERSQDWVSAAMAVLAEAGVGAVRVEVLANRLGVTKGGFYRRYRDRRALLDTILEGWVEGRIVAIQQQIDLSFGKRPAERLRDLIRFFAERLNPQGLAVELAIRQWGRSDPVAAVAVAQVDEARLAGVAALYEALGFPREEARMRAMIFYAVIFGQELLFLNPTTTHRDAATEACVEALVCADPAQEGSSGAHMTTGRSLAGDLHDERA
jgi:AcrR family transcriptional regulator